MADNVASGFALGLTTHYGTSAWSLTQVSRF